MMNWLVEWGVKKWVLGAVNKALEAHKDSVAKARETVAKYLAKVDALSAFLKSVDYKMQDSKITDDEADELVAEARELGKALVG